jgi:hypothetical protein
LHLAREAPWYMMRLAGQAQYRRSRLTSNVRPRMRTSAAVIRVRGALALTLVAIGALAISVLGAAYVVVLCESTLPSLAGPALFGAVALGLLLLMAALAHRLAWQQALLNFKWVALREG